MRKTLLISMLSVLAIGCTNATSGGSYAFHNVDKQKDGTWHLSLVGDIAYSKKELIEITKVKATEVCNSPNISLDSKENTFDVGYYNIKYPKIDSIVTCL
ncbi:hypothetical protein [Parashewanella tropica]|uniref:hypothetical protein n=1 Tax=Parashewanella tropica TaxID=2547970 RepID=UPI001059217D|nr:hypothetical protein [Parashewanella tropica]